jgi:hypothetical protein
MATEMQQTAAPTWTIWTILMKLYGMGVAFFLLKFAWGLFTIFKLYRRGEKQKNSDFSLIYTEGVKSPFSFFNWIFVNQKTMESNDYQQIILHESTHVRQRHSLDIVGLEILRGLFWLSPLVHLYARSLRNVHEYLADAAVLQNTEKKSYGRLLISQTAAGSGLVIANHLNFSQLKKRIIMMSRNPSQRLALAKYGFAAPVFLLIVVLLASPKTKVLAKAAILSETVNNTVNKMGAKFEAEIPETTPTSNNLITNTAVEFSDSVSYFDPTVHLSGKKGGLINKENLKKQTFLQLNQPAYEPPFAFTITKFKLIRVPFGLSANQESTNIGQQFNAETLKLIQQAQSGDSYQFVNVTGRYPGDVAARNVNNLIFIIGDNKEDSFKEQLNDKYPLEVKMAENTINESYAWKEGDNTGTMPEFPGGEAEIEKFINSNLKYPEACKKAGRGALFFVNYTITEEGYVTDVTSWNSKWSNPKVSTTNPKVAKFEKYEKMEAEDQPMIDEAFRIIKSMPRWKPGTRNGVVSRYSKSFMFKFILE